MVMRASNPGGCSSFSIVSMIQTGSPKPNTTSRTMAISVTRNSAALRFTRREYRMKMTARRPRRTGSMDMIQHPMPSLKPSRPAMPPFAARRRARSEARTTARRRRLTRGEGVRSKGHETCPEDPYDQLEARNGHEGQQNLRETLQGGVPKVPALQLAVPEPEEPVLRWARHLASRFVLGEVTRAPRPWRLIHLPSSRPPLRRELLQGLDPALRGPQVPLIPVMPDLLALVVFVLLVRQRSHGAGPQPRPEHTRERHVSW